jgi:hypothetical protein
LTSDAVRIDEHCRRVPAAPLRPYVAWYAGYRQRGLAPARHRGLPSPHLTLIFTLDEPMTMAVHPNPGQPPGEFGTLLGGLHRTPALIVHEGAQSGIQLALRPLGTRLLLGLPAGELAGIDVPAETVLGGVGAELHDRVRRASGWRERFAILDETLLGIVRTGPIGAAPDAEGCRPGHPLHPDQAAAVRPSRRRSDTAGGAGRDLRILRSGASRP